MEFAHVVLFTGQHRPSLSFLAGQCLLTEVICTPEGGGYDQEDGIAMVGASPEQWRKLCLIWKYRITAVVNESRLRNTGEVRSKHMKRKTTKKAESRGMLSSLQRGGTGKQERTELAAFLWTDVSVAVSGRKHRLAGIGVSDSGQPWGLFCRMQGVIAPADAPGRERQGKSRVFKDDGLVRRCWLVTVLMFRDIWDDGIHLLINHAVDVLGEAVSLSVAGL